MRPLCRHPLVRQLGLNGLECRGHPWPKPNADHGCRPDNKVDSCHPGSAARSDRRRASPSFKSARTGRWTEPAVGDHTRDGAQVGDWPGWRW
jgi:hypothetical protein